MVTFNEKQKLAIDLIKDFLSQQRKNLFYLLGYAGTGKTFLISHIIRDLLLSSDINNIYICAPTHKALNVIESYLKSDIGMEQQLVAMEKISYMTIHKLLEFKPVIMAEDGSKVFKPKQESKFLKKIENRLVILDECSMISKDMVSELKKYVDLYPIKIIFMGDNKQLPPVEESESLIFSEIPKSYRYHIVLDEIMRTNSSDIKEVCTVIRNWNLHNNLSEQLLPIHNRKSSFKIYKKKPDHLKSSWFKNFIHKLSSGKIAIILTWRNSIADYYNTIIRQYLHSTGNLDNYVCGDYAMFNNYYMSVDANPDAVKTNFYTSDMIKIVEISTEKTMLFNWLELIIDKPTSLMEKAFNNIVKKIAKIKNNFMVDTLRVEKIYSDVDKVISQNIYTIKTIHRNELTKYQEMKNKIQELIKFFFNKYKSEKKTSDLWTAFHKKLIDPYAEINFGYSITTYKSQGSTFMAVFVDVPDLNTIRNLDEFQKALYTSAGRASDELCLLVN